jgi:aspartyl-tRNA(Asn)/glutamyl-tRNA(Gln) amidotransferase subunit A
MRPISSQARIDAALQRADQADADFVFIVRLADEARRLAHAADVLLAAGSRAPHLGTPITVKDNFDIAGLPTTAGSRVLADAAPAVKDSAVVARLRAAGFVVIGRTNMTEFAFSGLGLNPHYGTPLNPTFPGERRIPGGSSSGAAVSVALGIAPAAIGTDTGGSIRIPAAFCGLVGFKPTANAISQQGVLPLSTSLDAVGVIARSTADCAAMFDVLRDAQGPARTEVSPQRIRLGVVSTYVQAGMDDHVADTFAGAVRRVAAAGVGVQRIEIPELADIPDMMRRATFAGAEAAAWHAPLVDRRDEYDPRVLVRILAGKDMKASDYVGLVERRRDLMVAVAARTTGFDALVWPTVPFVAPTIDGLADDVAYHAANGLALRNSTVANLLDYCAISIPCPCLGAPVGLTLAAPRGADDHLLSVAATIESLFSRSF